MIVVDTNVIAYLILQGTHTSVASVTLQKDPDWVAPLLWKSEFRNVLTTYMHKGSLSLRKAFQFMENAEYLMWGTAFEVESSHVLDLAANSPCSAYDCEFVALAEDLGIPLITTDQKILSSFPSIAISLESFVGR